ncbi:hypothetical protein GIY23_09855 [Allosaccharopolyspora coralli]|uniref:Uncharacterized protein n=1 Tax=Allosaccharopolyspora coralli TaxID=2665642 RepID=A0A5Q3Q5N5_9PSEU|nr:hypothetical protein [Allosaccharopolyspora coralli]QGK69782.1 hypothetical protein GIY23_09855 [Allosaccharopolyspora coralli]
MVRYRRSTVLRHALRARIRFPNALRHRAEASTPDSKSSGRFDEHRVPTSTYVV